ncbi:MAG: hypothetical protein H7Y30_17750 [Pyrinomonadaceae bacterium]|nr:hypothetical protein [Pyrinomonadaceae bacterium]
MLLDIVELFIKHAGLVGANDSTQIPPPRSALLPVITELDSENTPPPVKNTPPPVGPWQFELPMFGIVAKPSMIVSPSIVTLPDELKENT